MDAFVSCFEDRGDGMLGQPVDFQAGMESAQRVGDGHVPAGVPHPDRRRDVQDALGTGASPRPAARCGRPAPPEPVHEVADEQVDLDRVADVGAVA
jgi:hypothetical protein